MTRSSAGTAVEAGVTGAAVGAAVVDWVVMAMVVAVRVVLATVEAHSAVAAEEVARRARTPRRTCTPTLVDSLPCSGGSGQLLGIS